MDQIIVRNMVFYGRHGVLAEEKCNAQRFEIDIIIYKDLERAAATDDLAYSVDYSRVFTRVRDIVEKESFNLIETLAVHIGEMILAEFSAERIQVTVCKPCAPVDGEFEYFAVKIERSRK
jgi:dihydroneopterin aldolase